MCEEDRKDLGGFFGQKLFFFCKDILNKSFRIFFSSQVNVLNRTLSV